MAWTQSQIFRQWAADALAPTTGFAGKWNGSDVFKAALYKAAMTPDNTVTAALSAYNTGVWVTGNEVTDPNWAAGGRVITGTGSGGGYSSTGSTIKFDGADTAAAGNVTVTASGDLVYDDTLTTPVAKQGLAYHYFGASVAAVAQPFTLVWDPSGIASIGV